MTKQEKIEFISDLIMSVMSSINEKIDRIPEEWNGVELRRYIADKFEASTIQMTKARLREYADTVIERNI